MEVHDSPVIDSCLLLLKIIMMLKHRPSWLKKWNQIKSEIEIKRREIL